MRVTTRSRRLRMPQKLADDWKAKRCARANARERVPQIVDAKPFKPCRLGDGSPRPLEIDAGLPSPISGNDMGVAFEMRERREDGERRRAQIDQLLAGLAVGQEYDSALEVDKLQRACKISRESCCPDQCHRGLALDS
jgi:hypothetical protein